MANQLSVVYCWGNMAQGQLGFGGIEDDQICAARELTALKDKHVTDVACGVEHTLFLMQGGVTYACGNNDHGQLGHDKARRRPEMIEMLETQVISRVACGLAHSVAINDLGNLFTWGSNEFTQLGRQTSSDVCSHPPKLVRELQAYNVIQVACGYNHTLALTDDGRLFSWGSNCNGQLGIRTLPISKPSIVSNTNLASSSSALVPVEASPIVYYISSLRGVAVACIAAGYRHSVALTVSGALFTWGYNGYGQLGVGDQTDRFLPVLVRMLRSQKVRYVCCGEDHTAALTYDGGVFTFGAGMYGQLGHGSLQSEPLPRKVFELMGSEVTMLACGRRHTIAYVHSSGRLYTFGLGGNGQLGLNSRQNRPQPTLLPSLPSATSSVAVVSIYAGGDQCFVLAGDSQLQKSRDFRSISTNSQIVTLTKQTVQQYSEMCDVQKPSIALQSRIEKVFSSSSCLNASFLLPGDAHFHCSRRNHGVSISEAVEIFDLISSLKNDYVKQIIASVVETRLIPTLAEAPPPDVEALRVFLTLPYLHFFDNPKFYDTIICPFTNSLLHTLDKNAHTVLESWWCILGSAYLLKLVQIYKKVLLHILNESQTTSEHQLIIRRRGIYTCVEMLKRLNMVNMSSASSHDGVQLIPYEEFYVPELRDKVDLRKDFIHWLNFTGVRLPFDVVVEKDKLPMAPDGSDQLYCAYPFLFDGQAKTLLLQVDAMIQMQMAVDEVTRRNLASLFLPIDPVNPCLVLHISRNNIVQDTIAQLTKQVVMDFKKPLKVIFSGEEALDAGGVKKEFFLLLLKEVLDPKYGMFEYFSESRLIWFNRESFESTDMYMLIGVLCGLAIYNLIIIDINLPLALYRKLLKRKVSLDDLKQLQPSVGRSMQQLLDYTGDDFQDVFGISFEITHEVYGAVKTIELIPNGSQINVTQQNKLTSLLICIAFNLFNLYNYC